MVVNSAEMAARGKIGGFVKASRYSPDKLTAAARHGFLARFTPTDPLLSEEERTRRAQAALNAHMASLARKSATARRK